MLTGLLLIAKETRLYKHIISNYFDYILRSLGELNQNSIEDICAVLPVKNTKKLQLLTCEILKMYGEDAYSCLENCMISLSLKKSIDKIKIIHSCIEAHATYRTSIDRCCMYLSERLVKPYMASSRYGKDGLFFDQILIRSIFLTYQMRYFDKFNREIIEQTTHLLKKYPNGGNLSDNSYLDLQCICILAFSQCLHFNETDIAMRYFNGYPPLFIGMLSKMIVKLREEYNTLPINYIGSSSSTAGRQYQILLEVNDFYRLMSTLSGYFMALEVGLATKKMTKENLKVLEQVLEFVGMIKNFNQIIVLSSSSFTVKLFYRSLNGFLDSVLKNSSRYNDSLNERVSQQMLDILFAFDPSFTVLPEANLVEKREKIMTLSTLSLRAKDVSKFNIHIRLLDKICNLPDICLNMKINLNLVVRYISYIADNKHEEITSEEAILMKNTVIKNQRALTLNIDMVNQGSSHPLQTILSTLFNNRKFQCTEEELESIVGKLADNYMRYAFSGQNFSPALSSARSIGNRDSSSEHRINSKQSKFGTNSGSTRRL